MTTLSPAKLKEKHPRTKEIITSFLDYRITYPEMFIRYGITKREAEDLTKKLFHQTPNSYRRERGIKRKHTNWKKFTKTAIDNLIDTVLDINHLGLVSDYTTIKDKIEVQCHRCGCISHRTPLALLQGKGCSACQRVNAAPRTLEDFKAKFPNESLQLENWYMDEFKGAYQDTKFTCKNCGHHKTCSPWYLINATTGNCPQCNRDIMSSGERILFNLLMANQVTFKREYRVHLRDGYDPRFDFLIEDPNHSSQPIAVEYDGLQHYQYTPEFHQSMDDFHKGQARDEEKTAYAQEQGWVLIRVPYTADSGKKVYDILKPYLPKLIFNPTINYKAKEKDAEIADHYLKHGLSATVTKYNLSSSIIKRIFKDEKGMNLRQYLRKQRVDAGICNLYITHSGKDVANIFNVSEATVRNDFIKTTGLSKRDYIKLQVA